MISHTTAGFRQALDNLPESVRRQAKRAYKLFLQNPSHPSLNFKLLIPRRSIYSVRIGLDYRAVGIREHDTIIWFWIGSHADYDKLIAHL